MPLLASPSLYYVKTKQNVTPSVNRTQVIRFQVQNAPSYTN